MASIRAAIDRLRGHPRIVLGALAVALLVVLAIVTGPERVLAVLDGLADRPAIFAALLCGYAIVRPALAWPTLVLPIGAGYAFGVWGLLPAIVLLTLTGVPPYLVARRASGRGPVSSVGHRVVEATGDLRGVAAARFLPLPSDVISIGAGVADVRFRPYVLGTAIGESPWAVLGILVGLSIERLVAGDLEGFDPLLLAGMAAAGVLLLAGPVYRLVWKDD